MATGETVKKIKEPTRKSATAKQIEFSFHAPEAKKVYLAGTFNDWNTKLMLMKKGKDGVWRIAVKLAPGKYEYKFFVDGTWAHDVPRAESVPNPFGTRNCVLSIE